MTDIPKITLTDLQAIENDLLEKENQKIQEAIENKKTTNSSNYTDKSKESLSALDYQAMLAKAGQKVTYSPPETNTQKYLMTTPLILTREQRTDTSDALSCLSQIWGTGGNIDESQLQVTKRSDGKITDIIYNGVRYGIRYDEQGHIIKTIRQAFDDQGRINYQQVDNWENGNIKQQTEYQYEYDAQGNRIQTSREAWHSSDEGNADKILEKYFDISPLSPHINGMVNCIRLFQNVKKTQDGKITDFEWNGVRYSLRYDENGNVIKAISQKFDEAGNVTEQKIKKYDNGRVTSHIQYNYEYDESGQQIGETSSYLPIGIEPPPIFITPPTPIPMHTLHTLHEGAQDENGNMHYDINSFKYGTAEQRFGINEVPANCAEVQIDYKDGEANCVKFLDKDGNCIGHMYTKDQLDEDGTVKDDAKANNVILYDNAAKEMLVLNKVGNQPPEIVTVTNNEASAQNTDTTESVPVPSFSPEINYASLGQYMQSEGFDTSSINLILKELGGDNLNYAFDVNADGSKCLKILDENGIRIGHMYFDSTHEDNNKLIIYGKDTITSEEKTIPTMVYEFGARKKLVNIYDSKGNNYTTPA